MGSGLYLTVLGLLGLGPRPMIRHTAAPSPPSSRCCFVLPLIVEALPDTIKNAVGKYLPDNIGAAMTTVKPGFRTDVPTFSPWVSFGLLCAYAALALLIGAILMVRRDT